MLRNDTTEKRTAVRDDMEWIRCNLCGQDRSKLLFKRQDLSHFVSDISFCVVKCRNCGLVYVNPRPTEERIHSYYTEEFYQANLDKEQLLNEREVQLLAKFAKIRHLTPGRLLDVGCQKGEFLFFMQQKGWEVRGVEFSTAPPNLFDLDIFYGNLQDAGYAPDSFDLVTLWAVLEHAYNPKAMLHQVNRLLKPGGKVVLLVTNINSIPGRFMRHDDVPRHTTMFSKNTISKILQLTGFSIDKISFGQDVFSGSTRGFLNYLVKVMAGEELQDIVAQNRNARRWYEFAACLKGKDSPWMIKVDGADIAISRHLDTLLDRLRLGFIMIVEATKNIESQYGVGI